ncbi:MAG: BlaI/MecI/CopY family transcriptional regulator [Planctomycetes bacterium]|nr:BlaI/MecI/CopY family transcriptional regulator [Planctomycetota bacterium]
MPSKKLPKLTEAQLELMQIVWQKGRATVTEIWEALPSGRKVVRTTVMNVLARLAEKGWLKCRKIDNELVYSAAVQKDDAVEGLLTRLVDTAFGGSTANMVMTLFNSRGISEEEAVHLRRIIDESTGGRP